MSGYQQRYSATEKDDIFILFMHAIEVSLKHVLYLSDKMLQCNTFLRKGQLLQTKKLLQIKNQLCSQVAMGDNDILYNLHLDALCIIVEELKML